MERMWSADRNTRTCLRQSVAATSRRPTSTAACAGEALFPFGFGLSYTQFEIGKPVYSNNQVRVNVKNVGTRQGLETVQVYIRRLADKDLKKITVSLK